MDHWLTFLKKGLQERSQSMRKENPLLKKSMQGRTVEAKIDILHFDGAMDAERLDDWLRQLEVYFTC